MIDPLRAEHSKLVQAAGRGAGVTVGASLAAVGLPALGAVFAAMGAYAAGEFLAWCAAKAYMPVEGERLRSALEAASEQLDGKPLRDAAF